MNRLRNERGFTLLEIVIAIGILSFGLLAIASMQTSAIKGNTSALGLTEAMTLAQNRIEQMMSWPYADTRLTDSGGSRTGVNGLGDNPFDSSYPLPDGSDPGNPIQAGGVGRQYNVYWNVAQNFPIQNTKTIRVIVTWTERGNQRIATVDFVKADII
jgi:type IV pilus assembly protein PilV